MTKNRRCSILVFSLVIVPLLSSGAAWGSDCTRTSTGLVPLADLGGAGYLGQYPGGLYPGGANDPPPAHLQEGIARASAIQPLDPSGQPDPNGAIVLLSVGISNAQSEFATLIRDASSRPDVDHEHLVLLNGAASGQVADTWRFPTAPNYSRIRDEVLAPANLGEAQVQAVWLKVANPQPRASLPAANADAFRLTGQLGAIARALKIRYPNLQTVFLSSRIYAGYADTPLNPEPYAYESGFAVKWAIQAQIRQMEGQGADPLAGDLDYTGAAPLLAWGPYLWADGVNPRGDGLTWPCTDFASDGTHPSAGNEKVSQLLLDFFLRDPLASPWFSSGESAGITVTSPNGGEVLQKGVPARIRWTAARTPGAAVRIRLHERGRVLDITPSTPDTGEYLWTPPPWIPDAPDFLLEIASLSDPTDADFSDRSFSIQAEAAPVTVLTPNGGEVFVKGTTETIRWTGTEPGEAVRLRVLRGDQFQSIEESTEGDGAYAWTIPEWLPDAPDFVVEVAPLDDPEAADLSDNPFTIASGTPAGFTLTAPNGGETWRRGQTVTITWTSPPLPGTSVRIRLRNGQQGFPVSNGTPNTGSFVWVVPQTLPASSDYELEIGMAQDAAQRDTSDSSFRIE